MKVLKDKLPKGVWLTSIKGFHVKCLIPEAKLDQSEYSNGTAVLNRIDIDLNFV